MVERKRETGNREVAQIDPITRGRTQNCIETLSSSGLGRLPFTEETRIQIPVGSPLPPWHATIVAKVRARATRAASGCLEWTGGASAKGYGRLRHAGRLYSPHRVVLEAKLGRKLRRSEDTCHACDNPRCIEPEHLFAGSRADNMRDAYTKGLVKLPHQYRAIKSAARATAPVREPEP